MAIQIYSQKNNRWREFYNPLRALTLPKLVSLLEAGERGSRFTVHDPNGVLICVERAREPASPAPLNR